MTHIFKSLQNHYVPLFSYPYHILQLMEFS